MAKKKYRSGNHPQTPYQQLPKRPTHPNKIIALGFVGAVAVIFFAKEGIISPVVALAAITIIALLGYILYLQYQSFMRRLYPDDRPRKNYQFITLGFIALEALIIVGALIAGISLIPIIIVSSLLLFGLFALLNLRDAKSSASSKKFSRQ